METPGISCAHAINKGSCFSFHKCRGPALIRSVTEGISGGLPVIRVQKKGSPQLTIPSRTQENSGTLPGVADA